MLTSKGQYLSLHDMHGKILGVFIESELWNRCKQDILPILEKATETEPALPQQQPEPMRDWESLLEYWDFTYPPSYELSCEQCGATTADWRADQPRKFWLTAANLGGLAAFQCLNCQARIIKRHFKKHTSVECRPFIEKE